MTPKSFWTYQADAPPSRDEAIAAGAISPTTTIQGWFSLSPGMQREIVRSAKLRQEAALKDAA